jgi:precorrin-6B methylase 2
MGKTKKNTLGIDGDTSGFSSPAVHIRMLNDEGRTQNYIEAIRQTVKPGDVVMDLGSGTGVLAVAAAQAGASRVYAIEAGEMAAIAQRLAETNGVGNIVRVVRGRSSRVDLPEKGDVLVTETLGSHPFQEELLASVCDARKRFLKPDARIIPGCIRVKAALSTVSEEFLNGRLFREPQLDYWKESYGIDFGSLADANPSLDSTKVTIQNASQWTFGPESVLTEVDLHQLEDVRLQMSARLEGHATEACRGIVVWFEADLGKSFEITTDPSQSIVGLPLAESGLDTPAWSGRSARRGIEDSLSE